MKSSKQIKREIEVTNTSILKLSEEVKAKKAKVASLKAELKTASPTSNTHLLSNLPHSFPHNTYPKPVHRVLHIVG